MFPESGHGLPLEKSREFTEAVRSFLGEFTSP
jgi:hypothetical protein